MLLGGQSLVAEGKEPSDVDEQQIEG